MKEKKPKRKLVNYLLDPFLQFKFAGYIIFILVLFSACLVGFAFLMLGEFVNITIDLSEVPSYAREYVNDEVLRFIIGMIAILFLFFVFSAAFIVVETHRIVGAKIAILKYFREKLLKRDFESSLKIRKGDYFQDVVDVINEFASQERKTKK